MSLFDLEDQQRLERTQQLRDRIVTELTKDQLPTDAEDRKFLMDALNGIDRVVLTKARLKSDDNSRKSNEETAKTIAALLTRISEKTLRHQTERPVPLLESDIALDETVEGETAIGHTNLNYDQMFSNA